MFSIVLQPKWKTWSVRLVMSNWKHNCCHPNMLHSILQVMNRRRWVRWRATTRWSGAGSLLLPCPLHAAPLLSCRQPACSLSLAELPRDPVMLWKPCAYRKQCDTCAHTNTHTGINANRHIPYVHKQGQKHMKWIHRSHLDTFLPVCPTDGFLLYTEM